jgi:thymidylate kinase
MTGSPPGLRSAFVVVEGATGVGKSSVVEHLRAEMGAGTFHFPPEFLRFRAAVALDEAVAPLPRLAYYLAGCLHLSEMSRLELASRPVVLDRYLPSVAGLVEVDGGLDAAQVDGLAGAFVPLLLRPNVSVVLTASHDVAVGRLRARGRPESELTEPHRRTLASAAFFQAWQAAIVRWARTLGPVLELDTDRMALEDVCGAAAEAVREVALSG